MNTSAIAVDGCQTKGPSRFPQQSIAGLGGVWASGRLCVGNRSTCPSWGCWGFRPKRPRCPSLSDCMILIDSVWLHGIALVEYGWCFQCLECFDTMQYNQYAQKVSHQLMKTMQVTREQRGTLHESFEAEAPTVCGADFVIHKIPWEARTVWLYPALRNPNIRTPQILQMPRVLST